MRAQPTLTTTRLLLRPFKLTDANNVRLLANDKKIADTTANIPHPYSEGLAEQWIAQHQPKWQLKELCCYAIVLDKEEKLIGTISLMNMKGKQAELGYWVGVDYWNNGYCTEACKAVVAFGFDVLGLSTITAHHLTTNPSSGKVLLNVGFIHQGSDNILWPKTQNKEKIERYLALGTQR